MRGFRFSKKKKKICQILDTDLSLTTLSELSNLCACMSVCAHAHRFPPVDEADNGEVVCVKCVKGRAGSSSAVIHLYFRAEPRSNRHLTGEKEKIHCRHHAHSHEAIQRKCSARQGHAIFTARKQENRNDFCSVYSVFLLTVWQSQKNENKAGAVFAKC